ncbi:DEAD/DEAH box helicase [Eilatimonas milleporae]|uniref:AAA domain-containing protein n=1 Tax=Eilatimonas milleporae TaxID=911205 RepID=A0A3M0CEN8_9PROT|nr:ATP-binding protein [Eilatimonas milleporae]RMB01493.1 AAA domain-containing protein [Eilatimonas milleporae]
MTRPYFQTSISELEKLAHELSDPDDLQKIAEELSHRKTLRARKLAQVLDKQIGDAPKKATATQPQPSGTTTDTLKPLDLSHYYSKSSLDLSDPIIARLANWIAAEALSPQSYKRIDDLTSGDKSRIAKLGPALPWTLNERSRKNCKLYYEVILGAVDLNMATGELVKTFGQDEEKDFNAQSYAVIASVLVDKTGCPVEEDAVSISSFAWALPLSLNKEFEKLSTWPQIETLLKGHLEKFLCRMDHEGNPIPLTHDIISKAHSYFIEQFSLPLRMVSAPEFAVRIYHSFKAQTLPEGSLLNSFFIEDLADTIEKYRKGETGEALERYLGVKPPAETYDLLNDPSALEAAVAPQKIPPSRWPVGEKRALVLLQQAAVNITKQELPDTGIVSVNGPPGTGKTTLLRDIIAHAITDRATAMCKFRDPENAFTASGEKTRSGGKGFWHIYELDKHIKGHEILVASSNNSAVENISHELPDQRAISSDQAQYFKTVSDAIFRSLKENREGDDVEPPIQSWGLVAAALGNMKNRSKFQQVFWWDDDAAIRLYLKAAKGDNVVTEIKDDDTGKVIERKTPAIVMNETPPVSPAVAKQQWLQARKQFIDLKNEIEYDLEEIEQVRQLCLQMLKERTFLLRLKDQTASVGDQLSRIMPPEHLFVDLWLDVERDFQQNLTALMSNKRARPSWFQRLPFFAKGKLWQSLKKSYSAYMHQANRLRALQKKIDEKRHLCGDGMMDLGFFQKTHEAKQIVAPWLPEHLQKKREDLFVAALDVHKAFIDASAQKMLHNLSVLMNTFSAGGFADPKKQALMNELWSTLFLAVPVVSTAFASVRRMLGNLPIESLGWVMIDEAGQAVPQAAVGAILRAKRAVVVGDPIQIVPVVTLPERLVIEISRHFGVDPDIWAGPKASAQTLADQASKYQSSFSSDTGDRHVGIPLLVHRRCENPMFTISNDVAYNNKMVTQVKPSDGGAIRAALGPSGWFSVDGDASSKWCPEEGEKVVELFQKLNACSIKRPDIFIVTPFRIVAQEIRRRLRQERSLFEAMQMDVDQFTKKCVGTVHTVQGREADTVVFLLGAPKASQNGARRWAGSPENLLNVAVSRAKKNLYVVGSQGAWSGAGSFATMAKYIASTNSHSRW